MKTIIYSGKDCIIRTRFSDADELLEAEVLYDENAIMIEGDSDKGDIEIEDPEVADTPPNRVVASKTSDATKNMRSKFNSAQISSTLRRLERGEKIADVAKELGVTAAAIYGWKKKHADLDQEEAKYRSFKPPITEKQFRAIRLQKIEDISMADVADEFNVTEAVVERAWSVMTYDNYLRAERKASNV